MITPEIKKQLTKENYEIVGEHSAVKICRWTKKSLRDEGVCYKEKFYGIKSHLCCQMTPALFNCQNKCIHCWRDLKYTCAEEVQNPENPKEIIDGMIKAQQKLLTGFKIDKNSKKKQLSKANQKKYKEAQEPMQFAISLTGEPTLYPLIGDLIEELNKRKKTSFLVTNGLYPEKLQELKDKNQLPTQLYISVNTSNKEDYNKFHRSSKNDAWEKLLESLKVMATLKSRTVFRMNLVRNTNMNEEHLEEYAKLIKLAKPKFVEIKGYMAVGHARERLDYDMMPTYEEMLKFTEKLAKLVDLKLLDSHETSRAFVLGNDKEGLKIKE
jgi:tRNA wybutosine-synthesizing protein 1